MEIRVGWDGKKNKICLCFHDWKKDHQSMILCLWFQDWTKGYRHNNGNTLPLAHQLGAPAVTTYIIGAPQKTDLDLAVGRVPWPWASPMREGQEVVTGATILPKRYTMNLWEIMRGQKEFRIYGNHVVYLDTNSLHGSFYTAAVSIPNK
jgi:hypothetical protein